MRACLLSVLTFLTFSLFSQDKVDTRMHSSDGTAAQPSTISWQDMRAEKAYVHAATLYKERKYPQAAIAYTEACSHLNSKACTNLGFMYRNAIGVKKNYKLAAELYRRGSESGNAVGCANLGIMYWRNEVAKNDKRAAELFRKACNGGESGGCLGLGFMYQNGQGVPQDTNRAAELYRQACQMKTIQNCTQSSDLKHEADRPTQRP